jgi:hypothetical protein
MVIESALFLSGAVVGCFRPRRPWRWAVACVIAYAARDLVMLFSAHGLIVRPPEIVALLAANAGTYGLYAVPVLLGALFGGSIMNAGLR